jgi:hypothetical protein
MRRAWPSASISPTSTLLILPTRTDRSYPTASSSILSTAAHCSARVRHAPCKPTSCKVSDEPSTHCATADKYQSSGKHTTRGLHTARLYSPPPPRPVAFSFASHIPRLHQAPICHDVRHCSSPISLCPKNYTSHNSDSEYSFLFLFCLLEHEGGL